MPLKNILQSKNFQAVLGLLISGAVICWLVFSVNWTEVWGVLKKVQYLVLIPATAVVCLHMTFRSLRWRYLLPNSDRPKLIRLFDAIMVGNFATFVLPLRAGEFIRPYMLTLRSAFSFSTCFVSVVIERFFDLSMVLLTFGVMILFIENIPALAHQGAMSLAVMAFALLIFMLLSGLMPDRITGLCDRCLNLLPEKIRSVLSRFLHDFIRGASVLASFKSLAFVVALTLAVWSTTFLQYYTYLYMFDMQPNFWLAVTISIIVALAVAAPSAPGFVGVYQAGCVAAFTLFKVDKEVAVAYSIITHIHQFIFCIGVGMIVLLRNNLSLSDLRKQSQ